MVIKRRPKNHGTQSLYPNILLSGTNRSAARWENRKLSGEDEPKKRPEWERHSAQEATAGAQQGTNGVQKFCKGHTPLGEGWDRINGDNNSVTEVQ